MGHCAGEILTKEMIIRNIKMIRRDVKMIRRNVKMIKIILK